MEQDILKTVATRDLVNELASREGVSEATVDPCERFELECDGPARVFVVSD